MMIEHWLASACADAERRNLPGLKPLLTSVSQAMQVLRNADWNDEADGCGDTQMAATQGLKTSGSTDPTTPGSTDPTTPGSVSGPGSALVEAGSSDPAETPVSSRPGTNDGGRR